MSTPQAALPAGISTPERARTDWAWRKPVWAALAIAVMWVAVLVDAIWGGDIVANGYNNGGGGQTTVPSADAVALFASIATIFVARYGFAGGGERVSDSKK